MRFPKQLFEPLVNLQELNLSKTMKILLLQPNWLSNLKQLRSFSYAVNQLYRIPMFTSPDGVPLTPNLEELHLEDNNIRQIYAKQVEGLSSLKKLYLSRNSIRLIENCTFSNLFKLRYLYLDGNPLIQLEDQSLLTNSIVFMNLAKTGLFSEQQYSSFNPLNINNSISSLDLSGTNLNSHQLSGFVKYYRALRTLNVNQNNLKILTSETFQNLPSLEELLAANNSLTQISASSLPSKLWTQLKTLHLSGNPIRCDCRLIEFCQWIKAKNFSYSRKLLQSMQCVSKDGKRKSFPVLRVENRVKLKCLVEQNEWFRRALTATVFAISFLSTFASTVHRFRWNIRYWIFSHKVTLIWTVTHLSTSMYVDTRCQYISVLNN